MIRKLFLIFISLFSIQHSAFAIQNAGPICSKVDHAIIGSLCGLAASPAGLMAMFATDNSNQPPAPFLIGTAVTACCCYRSYLSFRAILGPRGAIIATAVCAGSSMLASLALVKATASCITG